MKRLLDVLVTVVAMPLWLPVAVLVAMLVAAVDGRPVFFSQLRTGWKGEPFRLWKFRTMREGEGDDGSRITRLGRWLRSSSLDELPELWNVLKGEMSLVGPRPLPVRYQERYSAWEDRRHEVRPGITGLAQVRGRNALDWATKFRYDVEYVNTRSGLGDLKILFLTALQLINPRNINHEGEATMSEFTGEPANDTNQKRYLSATEYLHDVWLLASKIRRSGWQPDFLVGLWRGGAPVAIAVHEYFKVSGWKVEHVPLKCASYTGIGSNPGEVIFTHGDMVFNMFRRGDKVLFVDDVFDSGKTAAAVHRKMQERGVEMRLACVYWKPAKNQTTLTPDYRAHDLGNGWLVFPHEIEGLSMADVRAKDPYLAELLSQRTSAEML